MSWFRRNKSREELLVSKIIEGEIARRSKEAEVETKKLDFELKRLELEGAQLEARGEEVRRERADREKLRQQRQEHAAAIRKLRAERRLQQKGANGQPLERANCRVCNNASDVSLTPDEIERHYAAGHSSVPVWQ